jgi:transposase
MEDQEITSSMLDHHGLVGGIIQELKIRERIDSRIPRSDPRCLVSTGTAVSAMILNGLGFTNRRLYLVGQFFFGKPLDKLLGTSGLKPEHLNDDALGKALDRIYQYGVTKLFCEVSLEILVEHNLLGKVARADTTTVSVEGEYAESSADKEGVIHITHGHSKDHRSDLKQLTVLLGMCGPANLPFWHRPLDGNASDKVSLPSCISEAQALQKELGQAPLFTWVADSALYSKERLLHVHYQTPWITRVPETINDAAILVEKTDSDLTWVIVDENYKFHAEESWFGGVPQRWLLVFSQKAYDREKITYDKRVEKEKVAFEKELQKLAKTDFGCEKDARKAYEDLKRKNRLFSAPIQIESVAKHAKPGRPKKGEDASVLVHHIIVGDACKNQAVYEETLLHKGRFILATNQLDHALLPNNSILAEYKGQQNVERGFSFLKDPWFLIDSVFLKNIHRIMALTMIMTLCLFVYNYAQYRIRQTLAEKKETVPNQLGKPVQNPTPKWLFQCMEGVAIVHILAEDQIKSTVTNINALRRQIIQLFGATAQKIYGFS